MNVIGILHSNHYSSKITSDKCAEYVDMGPSNQDVGKFSRFLTPTPLRRHFFTTIRQQIWQIFDPSSLPQSKECQRLKWMVPKMIVDQPRE